MSNNVIASFVLHGDPRTKKNSQAPVKATSKSGKTYTRLMPSSAYRRYESDCLRQIPEPYRLRINRRVNVRYSIYMQTHRVVDYANLCESLDDILKVAGVVEDDNVRVIATHDGTRVWYDHDNPRVVVTITPMDELPDGCELV